MAVLDWFSWYVVAWQLSDMLEMPFILAALDEALTIAHQKSVTVTRVASLPLPTTSIFIIMATYIFAYAANIWQNGRWQWAKLAKSCLGFQVGFAFYWLSDWSYCWVLAGYYSVPTVKGVNKNVPAKQPDKWLPNQQYTTSGLYRRIINP